MKSKVLPSSPLIFIIPFIVMFAVIVIAIIAATQSTTDNRSRASDEGAAWCAQLQQVYGNRNNASAFTTVCPLVASGQKSCPELSIAMGLGGQKASNFIVICGQTNPHVKAATAALAASYCGKQCKVKASNQPFAPVNKTTNECVQICQLRTEKGESCDQICANLPSRTKNNPKFASFNAQIQKTCVKECSKYPTPTPTSTETPTPIDTPTP